MEVVVKWEVPCRRDSSCQFPERRSSSWRRDSCRDSSGMAFEASKRSTRILYVVLSPRNLVSLLFYLHSWTGLGRHWARQIQIPEQGDKTVAELLSFVTVVPGLWFVFWKEILKFQTSAILFHDRKCGGKIWWNFFS